MARTYQDIVFDPFTSTTTDDLDLSHHSFDKIRNNCTFHMPKEVCQHITNNSRKLNILHVNARSIINKLDSLCLLLNETDIAWHVISVSETWLAKSLQNNYNIQGYHAVFCERQGGSGGGAAIYIDNRLCPETLQCPSFTTAEVTCAKIKLKDRSFMIICQIYRPPNSNKTQFNNELEQCLIWLNKMNKLTIITGDFNFDLFSIESNGPSQIFFTTQLSHGLFPTISRATRTTESSSTLIDNIFCNDLSRVAHSGIILSDLSDHFPIFTSLNIDEGLTHSKSNTFNRPLFDYKRINEFKNFLQTELQNFEQESCPDAMANKLINTYNKGITHFSYIKHNSRKHTPRMPWISPAILHSISHKNKLFKDKLRQPSLENITKYNKYKNTLTNIIRLAKKNYYKREFDKNSGNTKETWRTLQQLINSKQKNKSDDTPASLTGTNGKNTTGDDNIAEQFNTYFAEIGENLRKNIPPSRTDPLQLINEIDNEMELEPTNENELVAIVKKLNNVGAGVDNINSKLFKLSYQSIIKYLVHFFNSCLRTGTFPSALKMAIIKPIFKGGDTQLANNYRPISLLPIMSKILEKLIYRRLIEFVDENDIIHAHQFGFQKNKTTYMPILLLQDIITKAFEEGEFALGLYLDLRKAFDTVHIDILLKNFTNMA